MGSPHANPPESRQAGEGAAQGKWIGGVGGEPLLEVSPPGGEPPMEMSPPGGVPPAGLDPLQAQAQQPPQSSSQAPSSLCEPG